MNEIILLKLGEVVLKGLNRRSFEDKLNANIRRRLQHCGSFHVYSKQSTVYVEPQSADCDLDGAYAAFGKVIEGIENVNKIAETATDYSDRPVEDQVMKTVTVETFGVDYPEPDKIPASS